MSMQEDRARMEAIDADPLAKVIHDVVNALPHAQRLYPDTYATEVAAAVREKLDVHERYNRLYPYE